MVADSNIIMRWRAKGGLSRIKAQGEWLLCHAKMLDAFN